MTTITITSSDNQHLRHVRRLLDEKEYRYEHGEYVVEGLRALSAASAPPRTLYVREGTDIPSCSAGRVFIVAEKVFGKIASTEQSQGIAAVMPLRISDVSAIGKKGRYVLLDRIQDPGNLGTIIRTACAFGFRGIITLPGTADPFSPKVVRSAAGLIDQIEVIRATAANELKGRAVIGADMKGTDVEKFDWPTDFILAVGNEANGLSDDVRALCGAVVAIPLARSVESLNAGVSSGILLYLASR